MYNLCSYPKIFKIVLIEKVKKKIDQSLNILLVQLSNIYTTQFIKYNLNTKLTFLWFFRVLQKINTDSVFNKG